MKDYILYLITISNFNKKLKLRMGVLVGIVGGDWVNKLCGEK